MSAASLQHECHTIAARLLHGRCMVAAWSLYGVVHLAVVFPPRAVTVLEHLYVLILGGGCTGASAGSDESEASLGKAHCYEPSGH